MTLYVLQFLCASFKQVCLIVNDLFTFCCSRLTWPRPGPSACLLACFFTFVFVYLPACLHVCLLVCYLFVCLLFAVAAGLDLDQVGLLVLLLATALAPRRGRLLLHSTAKGHRDYDFDDLDPRPEFLLDFTFTRKELKCFVNRKRILAALHQLRSLLHTTPQKGS